MLTLWKKVGFFDSLRNCNVRILRSTQFLVLLNFNPFELHRWLFQSNHLHWISIIRWCEVSATLNTFKCAFFMQRLCCSNMLSSSYHGIKHEIWLFDCVKSTHIPYVKWQYTLAFAIIGVCSRCSLDTFIQIHMYEQESPKNLKWKEKEKATLSVIYWTYLILRLNMD